jgi:2-polyprenyl-3-methyl-5-hydroxy-6-metoxy-1,4-benzoquinol methylase
VKSDLRQEMKRFYQGSEAYSEDLASHDASYHQGFLAFVQQWLDPDNHLRLLDMGCGAAFSTQCLQSLGFKAVGSDLSHLFLQQGRKSDAALPLTAADSYSLPFADDTFDAVVCYEFIEHVPDVAAVLRESVRVLRPGGRLLISSPNLCSPIYPLADILRMIRGGGGRPVFAPTIPRAVAWFFKNTGLCLSKVISRPDFICRQPDLSGTEIGGDSDSAYLAHPYDLAYYLRGMDCRVLNYASGNRRLTRLLAKILPAFSPFVGVVVEKTGIRD